MLRKHVEVCLASFCFEYLPRRLAGQGERVEAGGLGDPRSKQRVWSG